MERIMSKPVAAAGSNLVQIVGLIVVLFGVFNLPSAGGFIALILGGILLAAATWRYMQFSKSDQSN